LRLGEACIVLERYEQARDVLEASLEYSGANLEYGGLTRTFVAFRLAQAKDRLKRFEPMVGLTAYNDFVNEYPNSPMAPRALLEMAAIYDRAWDLSNAMTFYRYVIQKYPDTEEARLAEEAITYILENQWGSVNLAKARAESEGPEQRLARAQWCGPAALQKLLARTGVVANEAELAKLAGTDETGTTMQGLIDAAGANGVELTGVEVQDPRTLPTPFIAFVNGNHFITVEEIGDTSLAVQDMGLQKKIVAADFVHMWGGQALMVGDAPETARLLDAPSLCGARGGHGNECCDGPQGDDSNCERCPDDGCPKCTGLAQSCSPTAGTGVSKPGIHATIHTLSTAQDLKERDVGIRVRGGSGLRFTRSYINPKGWHRGEFQGTSNPWQNNIGDGWTHNLNRHLKTSTGSPPTSVSYYDGRGFPRQYVYDSYDATYDYYYVPDSGTTVDQGNELRRNKSTGKYTLEKYNGTVYEFSAPTTDSNRFARIEAMKDGSQDGNQISLEYNGTVGTGKLTKVSAPSGDARYLALSYAGALITKVELKDSSGALHTTQYAYNGDDELTKVTDNASEDVVYAYDSYEYDTYMCGRYITKITDKAGNDVDFTWTWHQAGDNSEAKQINVLPPDSSLGTYARNVTSGTATLLAWGPGLTVLQKEVVIPVPHDETRLSEADRYLDTSNYEACTYEYDECCNLTAMTCEECDNEWAYNGYGRVSSITRNRHDCAHWRSGPKRRLGTTTNEYDTGGRFPTKVTGPDGLDVEYVFDAYDNLLTKKHPSVGSDGWRFAYDSYGQMTTYWDPEGNSANFAYDAMGNMTSMTNALSHTTTMYYDQYGNTTKVTDPRSEDTHFYYQTSGCGGCGGGGGKLTKVKDPLTNETEYRYDENGNMTKLIDALDRETDYAYDTMGRITAITEPGGETMSFTHDNLGRVVTTEDFEGNETTFEYDWMSRVITTTDPEDISIIYTYDSYGNVSTVTDGNGNTWTYRYRSDGSLQWFADEEYTTTHYGFDSTGRITKVEAGLFGGTDPTEYFYDGSTGRMTRAQYTSGVNTYNAYYHHHPTSGRLTKLTDWIDGTNGIRYTYDDAGRLSTITDYDDTVLSYAYDAAGNITSMNDYHGTVTNYTYTDTGQVSTINFDPTGADKDWDYDYNALGQPTQYSHPNGMTTAYAYDNHNRLTKIEHKDGDTVTDGFAYALDDNGTITKVTHQDDAYWKYFHDGRRRLTKGERYNSSDTLLKRYTYTYDYGDNVTTKQVYTPGSGTVTTAFSHNNANELTSMTTGGTTTNFTYDNWGRIASKYVSGSYSATYAYRYGLKLYSVTSDFPNEGNVTYQYGGDQKRRERTVGGTTTKYNWDIGWNVINEENSSGILTMTYIGRLADVSGSNPANGTYRYYSLDNLSSTRHLRAENKSSLGQYEYTPYGEVYSQSGVSLGSLAGAFTSKRWDDTAQLYYFPYRHYSPSLGRWLVRDPLGMIDGPNTYSYVRGRVVGATDPTGLGTDRERLAACQEAAMNKKKNCRAVAKRNLDRDLEEAAEGHELAKTALDRLEQDCFDGCDKWSTPGSYINEGCYFGCSSTFNILRGEAFVAYSVVVAGVYSAYGAVWLDCKVQYDKDMRLCRIECITDEFTPLK
jgi:RHS repeat-associated protein